MAFDPRNRTPLAWRNLVHEPRRLLLAAGGIGFAVLLMFMQLGFRGALFDSTVRLMRKFNADLVMVSPAKSVLSAKEMFSHRRLYQAQAHRDVADAWPFYVEVRSNVWKNATTKHEQPIRVLAFNPRYPTLNMPEVLEQAPKLEIPGTVLFDRLSKPDFGRPEIGTVTELGGNRVKVVGYFTLGTDFADDGTVIMSDTTLRDFFYPPLMRADALIRVDFGLIKLKPGADSAQVAAELNRDLPDDVIVRTIPEQIRQEQIFWSQTTPIGYVFSFGTLLGFIVGVIICYQILFSDINDHLGEYATLKAMGYRNRYFVSVVLQESLLLSVFGFIPGVIVAFGLYAGLQAITGLEMNLSLPRAITVFVLAALMCMVSGALAMRRVLSTDPAELFR